MHNKSIIHSIQNNICFFCNVELDIIKSYNYYVELKCNECDNFYTSLFVRPMTCKRYAIMSIFNIRIHISLKFCSPSFITIVEFAFIDDRFGPNLLTNNTLNELELYFIHLNDNIRKYRINKLLE